MPRSGLGVFTAPFPDVVEGTTIESTVHNGTVADFVTDANAARPITAGGTGATTAAAARDNLDAEVAAAQVTNYDSHVFENGSFYSQPGATGQPVNSNVSGTAVIIAGNPDYINITARDNGTNLSYARRKTAGTWGAWTLEGDDKVSVAGDTMTGNLTITKTAPTLALQKPGTGTACNIYGYSGAFARWELSLGNGTAEAGAAAGSDFTVTRFSDAGAAVSTPLSINRATGAATFGNTLGVTGALNAGSIITSGALATGSTLAVTGAATFGSTLGVTGALNAGSITTSGALATGSTLAVTGTAGINGEATLNSTVAVGCTPAEDLLTTGNDGVQLGKTSSYGPTSYFSTYSATIPGPTAIYVGVSGQDGYAMRFFKNGALVGNILLSTSATAFNTSSDARLKDDLRDFDAGAIIDSTNAYDFKWKSNGKRSYGILAQEAQKVFPTAVDHHVEDDWYGIDYSKYVPVLLQELKALRARVAELEDRLNAKPS